MRELDGNWHIRPAADRLQHAGHRLFIGVIIETDVAIGDAAFGLDRRRLDDEQRGTGERQLAEVDHMPIGHRALFGRILAHGRNDDAIGEFKHADAEGGEELRVAHLKILSMSLSVQCEEGWRGKTAAKRPKQVRQLWQRSTAPNGAW